ncbi:hypothetical protein Clacol_006763 [Clathrus columnatus]|uniref:Protection of telomeres protein 1 n=1 Tax=Clathrus columnatus TaxID=1419009 RepID=A0AAV5AKR4_9AGAM|nr:hypothetical protein Clacol_006763 [Clathrus columnatus]
MNVSFLSGQRLCEDEFMLCDSLPSNKHLEGQVRMVWPVQGNIYRVQLQLVPVTDESKYFETLFHNWPTGYELKSKDVVLLLLKGASKTPMLKQGRDERCHFRITYRHGAVLRVRRDDKEILINYFEEKADVKSVTSSLEITEDKVESHDSRGSFDNSRPVTSMAKRSSPPLKKSKRHKKKHKNKNAELNNRGQNEGMASVRNGGYVDHSATSNPEFTLSVEEAVADLFAHLPESYTVLEKVAYANTHSVIGIVTDAGVIKPTRTGEIIKSFIIIDPSFIDQGLTINTFAEQQDHSLLPSTCYGQILLLRNVYIRKFNGRLQGNCFKDKVQWCGYDPSLGQPFYSTVEQTAPNNFFPVSSDELNYCNRLANWWNALQNEKHTTAKHNENIIFPRGFTDRLSKLAFVSELQAYKFSDCVVELCKVQHIDERRTDIYVTDYSENEGLEYFKVSDFPLGRRTLKVTLWEEAKAVAGSLIPGEFCLLRNMKMKVYGSLEGSVGGFGFEGIQPVKPDSPQPNLPELLAQVNID